ncbi:tectonin beta-propeller repeat-containing protein 2 isoform X1 [Erpetoichthys calabaricus]|uniref:Tectonin beta-propeller repeat containing 2 n=1 Tax=Erpetoichthys calabaricus TaxID=27687 RepID=A0A8C4T687_ERPCA|nr:tectonin beta-propeller repeat-containing protein 2 isoform X1 [Erpetoichthys calabaricus]
MAENIPLITMKEFCPLYYLLNAIPSKVQKGFRSVVVYLTALDATSDYIAMGSSIGMLYLYCRRLNQMKKYNLEGKSESISSVKLLSCFDDLVAVGTVSGRVILFQLVSPLPGRNKQLRRFDVVGIHKSTVTSLAWSANGMKLFSGDDKGKVVYSSLDLDQGVCNPILLLEEQSAIVQLEYNQKVLLVSTYQRSLLFYTEEKVVQQIGTKPRKSNGKFGCCFQPGLCKRSDLCLYTARPGLRLWKADVNGKVQATHILKDLFANGVKQFELYPRTGTGSTGAYRPTERHLGLITCFLHEGWIVSWNEYSIYVIDTLNQVIIGGLESSGDIVSISCTENEIFLLKGDRDIIRISNRPEGITSISMLDSFSQSSSLIGSSTLSPSGSVETAQQIRTMPIICESIDDKLNELQEDHGEKNDMEMSDYKNNIKDPNNEFVQKGNSESRSRSSSVNSWDSDVGLGANPDQSVSIEMSSARFSSISNEDFDQELVVKPIKVKKRHRRRQDSISRKSESNYSESILNLEPASDGASTPASDFLSDRTSLLYSSSDLLITDSPDSFLSSDLHSFAPEDTTLEVFVAAQSSVCDSAPQEEDREEEHRVPNSIQSHRNNLVFAKPFEVCSNMLDGFYNNNENRESEISSNPKDTYLLNEDKNALLSDTEYCNHADHFIKDVCDVAASVEPGQKRDAHPLKNASSDPPSMVVSGPPSLSLNLEVSPKKLMPASASETKFDHPLHGIVGPISLTPKACDREPLSASSDDEDIYAQGLPASSSESGLADIQSPLDKQSGLKSSLEDSALLRSDQFAESWMRYYGPGHGILSLVVSEKYAWCLDFKGSLFCSAMPSSGLRWQKFEDNVQQVAVSPSGALLWKIEQRTNKAFACAKVSIKGKRHWYEALPQTSFVALSNDAAWIIRTNGDLYLQSGLSTDRPCARSVKVECPCPFSQIACRDNVVWALTEQRTVFYREGLTSFCIEGEQWKYDIISERQSLEPVCISLGDHQTAWALDTIGNLWFRTGISPKKPQGEDDHWWQVSITDYVVFDQHGLFQTIMHATQTVATAAQVPVEKVADKLRVAFWSQQPQCQPSLISVNSSGVWITSGKNEFHVAKGSLIGTYWNVVVPRGTASATKWAFVFASAAPTHEGSFLWLGQTFKDLFCISDKNPQFRPSTVQLPHDVEMVQFSACQDAVWGLDTQGFVFIRALSKSCPTGMHWTRLDLSQLGRIKLVSLSCGSQNVWACDVSGMVYFRVGTQPLNPSMMLPAWICIEPPEQPVGVHLIKIYTSPNDRMLWVIDNRGNVHVRTGITEEMPVGTIWEHVPGLQASHLAVSRRTVWVCCPNGDLARRYGITDKNPAGDYWKKIPGCVTCLTVTPLDELWAVSQNGCLIQRLTKTFRQDNSSTKPGAGVMAAHSEDLEDEWEVI